MSTPHRLSTLEQALAELAAAQMQTERSLNRLSEEMRAFKNEMSASSERNERAWRRQWGELANRMGTLVEDIVAPGIPEIFRQRFGFEELELAAPRMRRRHRMERGRSREFDYVAMAGDLVLVNETKSTLRPDDIPAFLEVLGEVREYLPEAEGRAVVGSLASFSIDPSLVTAGERQGLLMLGLATGLLDVLNTPGFEPRRF